jgi:hypothetical protein
MICITRCALWLSPKYMRIKNPPPGTGLSRVRNYKSNNTTPINLQHHLRISFSYPLQFTTAPFFLSSPFRRSQILSSLRLPISFISTSGDMLGIAERGDGPRLSSPRAHSWSPVAFVGEAETPLQTKSFRSVAKSTKKIVITTTLAAFSSLAIIPFALGALYRLLT